MEGVKTLTGTMTAFKFEQGSAQLQRRFNESDLSALSTKEQCLSQAASWAAAMPVIVIEKPTGNTANVPAIDDVAPDMANSEVLAQRLMDVDGGYQRPNAGAREESTQYHNQFPERARRDAIQGMAYQINMDHRSLASAFSDHCVVVRDTSEFSQYVKGQTRHIGQGLNDSLRQWVERYGNAAEFWHEVGHCRFHGERTGVSADLDSLSQPETNDPIDEPATCGVEADQAAEQNEQVRDEAEQASLSTADARLLIGLTEEASADAYAMERIRQFHGHGLDGCRAGTISNELSQLRLAMGIQWPRTQYMGWLMPQIQGQLTHVAAQVAADAWAAFENLSAEYARQDGGSFRRQSLNSRMYTPTLEPDATRQEQWHQWLESQVHLLFKFEQ